MRTVMRLGLAAAMLALCPLIASAGNCGLVQRAAYGGYNAGYQQQTYQTVSYAQVYAVPVALFQFVQAGFDFGISVGRGKDDLMVGRAHRGHVGVEDGLLEHERAQRHGVHLHLRGHRPVHKRERVLGHVVAVVEVVGVGNHHEHRRAH